MSDPNETLALLKLKHQTGLLESADTEWLIESVERLQRHCKEFIYGEDNPEEYQGELERLSKLCVEGVESLATLNQEVSDCYDALKLSSKSNETLQKQVSTNKTNLEAMVKQVLELGLSTGHADDFEMLTGECVGNLLRLQQQEVVQEAEAQEIISELEQQVSDLNAENEVLKRGL